MAIIPECATRRVDTVSAACAMSGYLQRVNGVLDDQMAVIILLILSDAIIAAIAYTIGRRRWVLKYARDLDGDIFMSDSKSHIDLQRDVD